MDLGKIFLSEFAESKYDEYMDILKNLIFALNGESDEEYNLFNFM